MLFMFVFSMVSSCRVIYFIFFWSLMILRSTDGGSVTWYEPSPVETTSDHNIELTADSRQLLKGSTRVQLSWNFSLTPILNTVILSLNSVTVVTIVPSSGIAGISSGFEGRFNATWISQRATLIIFNVTEDDDGEFGCELNTFEGVTNKIWKRKMKVEVLVPVSLTNVSADQTVSEGSNMQLFCEVTGKPTPNISWTRVLEDGSNSEVLRHGPTWNFSNINRTDTGTYCCTAGNGVGNPVSHKVKVNVTYPAKILNVSASKHDVEVHEGVSLQCTAEGNPEPTYTWMPCDPRHSVCHQSKLVVSKVLYDGVYICTVANSLGNNSGNVSVFIAGKVINITLVITSESCTNRKFNQSSLWIKLNKTFDEVFANESTYNSSQLTDVRCGSVTTDVRLKFNSIVRERDVIDTIRSAVENGMLGEVKVNVSSITGTRPVIEKPTQVVTTTPSSPSDSKTWIIVGAVLGLVTLLVIAAVIAWCVYRKRKCKKRDTKEVHNNGSQGEAGKNVQGEGYVQVNKGCEDRSNRQYGGGKTSSAPPVLYDTAQTGDRGAVRGQPVAQYAMVDKSKKKPRKPQPGELQYAELAEFSTGQGGQRSSLSPTNRHTETQYADVNAM